MLSRGRALMDQVGLLRLSRGSRAGGFRSEAPPLTTTADKTGGVWLRALAKDPRAVGPNATMPNFQLADEEIDEISHYLFISRVPWELARRIQAAGRGPAGDAGRGKKLFSESRCISCHTVEGKGNGSAPELSKVASAATRAGSSPSCATRRPSSPARDAALRLQRGRIRDVVAYMEDELRDFDTPKDMLAPVRVNQRWRRAGPSSSASAAASPATPSRAARRPRSSGRS